MITTLLPYLLAVNLALQATLLAGSRAYRWYTLLLACRISDRWSSGLQRMAAERYGKVLARTPSGKIWFDYRRPGQVFHCSLEVLNGLLPALPPGLKVHGQLSVVSSSLHTVGSGLFASGKIYLEAPVLRSLPPEISCAWLELIGCTSLTEVPSAVLSGASGIPRYTSPSGWDGGPHWYYQARAFASGMDYRSLGQCVMNPWRSHSMDHGVPWLMAMAAAERLDELSYNNH